MRQPKVLRLVGFAICSFSVASCNNPAEPSGPDQTVGVPVDWVTAANPSAAYEIGIDHFRGHEGTAAAYIAGPQLSTPDFGYIAQLVKPDNYLGKRVRFSAWVRGIDIVGPIAGLYMAVEGSGAVTGYDNMANRPEAGTSDWHQVRIVLDVPSDALGITIGVMRRGGGILVVDDMQLEVVGNDFPTTNMYSAPLPNSIDPATTLAKYANARLTPVNLDFERKP